MRRRCPCWLGIESLIEPLVNTLVALTETGVQSKSISHRCLPMSYTSMWSYVSVVFPGYSYYSWFFLTLRGHLLRAYAGNASIIIAHQTRSAASDTRFFSLLKRAGFDVAEIHHTKHHPEFHHPLIHMFIITRRRLDSHH